MMIFVCNVEVPDFLSQLYATRRRLWGLLPNGFPSRKQLQDRRRRATEVRRSELRYGRRQIFNTMASRQGVKFVSFLMLFFVGSAIVLPSYNSAHAFRSRRRRQQLRRDRISKARSKQPSFPQLFMPSVKPKAVIGMLALGTLGGLAASFGLLSGIVPMWAFAGGVMAGAALSTPIAGRILKRSIAFSLAGGALAFAGIITGVAPIVAAAAGGLLGVLSSPFGFPFINGVGATTGNVLKSGLLVGVLAAGLGLFTGGIGAAGTALALQYAIAGAGAAGTLAAGYSLLSGDGMSYSRELIDRGLKNREGRNWLWGHALTLVGAAMRAVEIGVIGATGAASIGLLLGGPGAALGLAVTGALAGVAVGGGGGAFEGYVVPLFDLGHERSDRKRARNVLADIGQELAAMSPNAGMSNATERRLRHGVDRYQKIISNLDDLDQATRQSAAQVAGQFNQVASGLTGKARTTLENFAAGLIAQPATAKASP